MPNPLAPASDQRCRASQAPSLGAGRVSNHTRCDSLITRFRGSRIQDLRGREVWNQQIGGIGKRSRVQRGRN
jgi:hypothetical protein